MLAPSRLVGKQQVKRWQAGCRILDAAAHAAGLRVEPVVIGCLETNLLHSDTFVDTLQRLLTDCLKGAAIVDRFLVQAGLIGQRQIYQPADAGAVGYAFIYITSTLW